MDGWSKVAAGVALGVAGTVYATNKKLRKRLPSVARDLPENVKRRFESAVSAAREASSDRREEILRNLEAHAANHPPTRAPEEPPVDPLVAASPEETAKTTKTARSESSGEGKSADDETEPPSPS